MIEIKFGSLILLGLLIIAAIIYFTLNPPSRLLKCFWIWRMKHNKQFLDGIHKGLKAYHQGKVRPWSEVKKELNTNELGETK